MPAELFTFLAVHLIHLETEKQVVTDVVVLTVAATAEIDIQELWVAFGTGRHFRYIPAQELATSLGPDKSRSLPIFHAYTGCDTVSSFGTKENKLAWGAAIPPTAGVRQLQLLKSCHPLMTGGGLNHPTGNRCVKSQHVLEGTNFLWMQKRLQRTIQVQ